MSRPDLKAALRREALARRDALDPEWRAAASDGIAAAGLPVPLPPSGCVSGFWPIRSEVDPRPLMAALAARGASLALPAVTPGGLVFRRWRRGDRLVRAGFGLSEPPPDAQAVEPAVMLVPLACFDRRGHRVGYGAGYYDRAIARYAPAVTIGLAFSVQEVAAVPDEGHDRALDWIVTEAGTIRCRAE